MIGIYKIQNILTNQIYIGQSTDIMSRWQQETSVAFNPNKKEYNYPLSQDFRKFGIKNFTFEILEECVVEQLNEKERYWIDYYDSYQNGYNQNKGGGGSLLTLENKEQIIAKIKNLLKTTNLFHHEIAEVCQVSTSFIQGINVGRLYYDNTDLYPLQQQQKGHATTLGIKALNKCKICNKIISKGAEYCQDCYNILRQSDKCPKRDELKILIRTTSFAQIGKKFGVSDNAVRKWCDKYKLPRKVSEIKKYSDKEWELL